MIFVVVSGCPRITMDKIMANGNQKLKFFVHGVVNRKKFIKVILILINLFFVIILAVENGRPKKFLEKKSKL